MPRTDPHPGRSGARTHRPRPEQARSVPAAIKSASKEALGEVRQVLGTLREPEATAPRGPAPGLDRLDELADRARRTGPAVGVRFDDALGKVPAAIQRAAFRITRKSLTSVILHSAARSATVLLSWTGDGFTVQVDGPGPAGSAEADGSEAGLTGTRERIAPFGGSLEAGPHEAGFRVRARLTKGDG